jgi:hypothetical protein
MEDLHIRDHLGDAGIERSTTLKWYSKEIGCEDMD